jgi:hypothetical protein
MRISWTVVLLTEQHDLKPEVLDPAQMVHQAGEGHERGAGKRGAAGVGLGEVLPLGVDGGADVIQEGGEDRALVPASWDVGPRHGMILPRPVTAVEPISPGRSAAPHAPDRPA